MVSVEKKDVFPSYSLFLKSNSFIPSNERFRPFKSDIEEMSSIGKNVSKVIYKERVKLSLTIHMPNKESVQKIYIRNDLVSPEN